MTDATRNTSPVLIEPLPRHRFNEAAFAKWWAETFGEEVGQLGIRQFQGGMSNPTFLVSSTSGKRYVLRKKPPGKLLIKAHAVDREYRVLRALGPTSVPTPKVIAYCDNPGVIGAEFFLMEYIEGRVVSDSAMGPIERTDRSHLVYSLVDTLADLHQVDWRACGLEGFGRPEGYLARQTTRWSGQYEASKSALPADFDYSDMDWLREWLMRHVDMEEESAITHGDYRVGNTVVHPTEPRVIGVLDWELSTIGHPLSDLAYFCLPYRYTRDAPVPKDLVAEGWPTEQQVIERYMARTGRTEIRGWKIFLAFNFYRVAAITQGVAARAAQGTASSASADPVKDGARARRMGQIGAEIARSHDWD